jgi:tetratricopeptide (TPR) repeat protein
MNACPSENVVMAYAEGRLDPAESGVVRKHASQCTTCGQRLSALSGAGGTMPESAAVPSSRKQVGRYALVRVLGSGGMGAVYEAHDTELDRRVAIKLLRERFSDESSWRRLRREAQAMAKLAHPNVVSVFDVAVAEGQPYLTMELVDGVTLTAWLRERSRTWRQILDTFAAAGRGLAAAHAVGIVHRDFKPDNVLVSRSGRVCVTDFGIAAGELDASARGVTGTPAYMAPEQMSLSPFDARADVFSFCVALYEALYGTRPFTGRTLSELRDAIVAQEANPPTRRGAPACVKDALSRGLRALPDERFSTMDALLSALDPAPRARVKRRALLACFLVLAACAGVFAWRLEARRAATRALLLPSGPTRVAVVVVDAIGDGAADAVARIVAAGVAVDPRVVVTDPALVARMGGADAPRVAAAAGASRVVVVRLDGSAIEASVVDAVPSRAPLWRVSERSRGGAWVDAARRLATDLGEALGASKDAARSAAEVAAPGDAEAALLMGRALHAEHAHDLATAASLLDDACNKDATSPAPCAERAAVLEQLGDRAPAVVAARAALDRSPAAPASARAEIDALSHSVAGEFDVAVARDRDLWSARPDDRRLALALATDQLRMGAPRDAQATIDAVRARGVAAGDEPEIDLLELRLKGDVGDVEGALSLARMVVARAESIADPWLAAAARQQQARVLFNASRTDDAESIDAVARDGYVSTNDLRGAAWVDMNRAIARGKAGDLEASRAILEDVGRQANALGDRILERVALLNLGVTYTQMSELVAATDALERAVALLRGMGEDRTLAGALSSLCSAVNDHGDMRIEPTACDEALSIQRRLGDRMGLMISIANLEDRDSATGDLVAAEAHGREALTLALELGTWVPWMRYGVAGTLAIQGRTAEESMVRAGIDESIAGDSPDTEAMGRAFLANLLGKRGKVAEAREALAQTERALARTENAGTRSAVALDRAYARLRIAATQAERDAVAKDMGDLAADATRTQRLGLVLAARLARARAEGARADYEAIVTEAHELGLEGCARDARAAAEGKPIP